MRHRFRSMLPLGLIIALVLTLGGCDDGVSPASPPSPTLTAIATMTPVATAVPTPTAGQPAQTPAATLPSRTPAPTPIQETSATATANPATATPAPTTAATPATTTDRLAPALYVQQLSQHAMDRLVMLTSLHSPRASGTEEELAAAEYLLSRFEALGYETRLQPFDVQAVAMDRPLLSVISPVETRFPALPLSMTAPGQVQGVLVDVGLGLEGGPTGDAVRGKIALIQRGEISFQEKIRRVAESGAIAAVIYNNVEGPFLGSLNEQSSIPAVSIPQADGATLKDLMERGPVEVSVNVTFVEGSQNVLAVKPGAADDGRVVVLGGHYDTVPNVPGANDNGSGIASLLTIATEIADARYPFTIHFVAFGAEEIGLFGSKHYVAQLTDEEKRNTIAMMNFDALGSGPVTGALGSFNLTGRLAAYAEANGLQMERRATLTPGTNSDHAPFDEAGIPVVFFLGDDFSRIHTPEDQLQYVDPALLGTSAVLGIALLDMLAEEDGTQEPASQ